MAMSAALRKKQNAERAARKKRNDAKLKAAIAAREKKATAASVKKRVPEIERRALARMTPEQRKRRQPTYARSNQGKKPGGSAGAGGAKSGSTAGTRKPKPGIEPQAAASGYAVDIPKSQRDLASAYKKHGAGLEAFERESLARFRKKGGVKKKAVKKKATAKKETPTKRYRRQRRRAPGRVR